MRPARFHAAPAPPATWDGPPARPFRPNRACPRLGQTRHRCLRRRAGRHRAGPRRRHVPRGWCTSGRTASGTHQVESVGAPIRVHTSVRKSSRVRAVPGRAATRTQSRPVTFLRAMFRSRRRTNRARSAVRRRQWRSRGRCRALCTLHSGSRSGNPPDGFPAESPDVAAE